MAGDVHVAVPQERRHDELLRQRVHGKDHHGVRPAGVVVLPGVHTHNEQVVDRGVCEERPDVRGHVAGHGHVEEVGEFLRIGGEVEAGRGCGVFRCPRHTLRTGAERKGAGRGRRHHQADGEHSREKAPEQFGFHG